MDDPALAPEVKLVADVHGTLALLSGHMGEMQPGAGARKVPPLVGVWRSSAIESASSDAMACDYVVIWANGVIDFITTNSADGACERAETLVLDGKVPRRAHGMLRLHADDAERVGAMRYALKGDSLTLDIERGYDDEPLRLTLTRLGQDDDMADATPGTLRPDDGSEELDELTGLPAHAASS